MMSIMFSSFKTKKVFNFHHFIYSTGFAICQLPIYIGVTWLPYITTAPDQPSHLSIDGNDVAFSSLWTSFDFSMKKYRLRNGKN